MINSGKVDDPNKFAKKLVEQKIAANMDDAMEKLAVHDDVIKEEEVEEAAPETEAEEKSEEPEVQEPEKEEEAEEPSQETQPDSRLEELENKLNMLNEMTNQLKGVMNKNFREIDQRLNELKQLRKAPEDAKEEKSAKKEKKQQKKGHPKCDPDNYDTGEVSVESIFSNAHGRLMKKK